MFKRKYISLFINLVSIFVILGVLRSLYSLWQKKDIVPSRREELAKLEQRQRNLKKKLEEAQSPEFIEKTARESLGMIKEGEAIVLLPRTQNPELNDQKEETMPNWKKWWKLFF